MQITRRVMLLGTTAAVAFPYASAEQPFPIKPIRLILPFPAGSTSDLIARRLGEHVTKSLGQAVVVESKPGGQGVIAARTVLSSPKDGYTLLYGTNSSHAANVYMIKNLEYDPVKDFTPITQFSTNPLLLVVNSKLPVNTVQEFIKYAKERPGNLNYGTGNAGGLVAAHLLKNQAGIDAVGVNYQGTSQAATDLIAGRLDFMLIDPLVVHAFVQAKKIRMLGVTSKERLPSLPDVPSLAESGLPNFNYVSWGGLFGPAGLQPEITRKLNQAFMSAVLDPSTQRYFAELGMMGTGSTPDVFKAFVQDQVMLWSQLAKDAGLQPL